MWLQNFSGERAHLEWDILQARERRRTRRTSGCVKKARVREARIVIAAGRRGSLTVGGVSWCHRTQSDILVTYNGPVDESKMAARKRVRED